MVRRLVWLAPLLSLAGLGTACRLATKPMASFSAERAGLREALGQGSPGGASLVGGLTVAQQAPGSSAALNPKAVAAIRAIKRRVERDVSAEALADFGVLRAVAGQLRGAETALQHAAEIRPQDARILSDLGAVYLSEAGSLEGPARFEALDAVDRALHLAPDLAEARSNLARALEANFLLDGQPARSHSEIVKNHSAHQEAVSRTKWPALQMRFDSCTLPCQSVGDESARFPREARKFAEERLLPRWAELIRRDEDAAAAQTLDLIARIGRAAVECCGDSMLADAAAELRRPDAAAVRRLAQGVRQATEGIKACQAYEGVKGAALLVAAARAFGADNPPLRAWARYGLGLCAHQRAKHEEAISILKALERDLGERYPSLRLRLLWVRGGSFGWSGRHAECLRDYFAAHELAERVGAPAERAGVDFILHETLWLLGQRRAAWRWLFEGCGLAVEANDPRRLTVAFAELFQAAQESGTLRAALRFADRLVKLSTPDLGQAAVAYALYTRARAQAAVGSMSQALIDLAAAEDAAAKLSDTGSRRQWQSDIWGERGRLLQETAPSAASRELFRAVSAAQELHDSTRLVHFLVELARAQAALRDPEAVPSLRRALTEVERQRLNVAGIEERADFLVRSREVYDQWMTTALETQETPAAIFRIAEQARARGLRDALGRSPVGVEIAQRLGSERALLEFAVLPHRLLTWVLRAGRVSFHVQSVDASDLEAWVRSLTSETDKTRTVKALRCLSQVLTGPVRSQIAGASTLLVSPDKSLRRVPFAELIDLATGRPLIEDHAVVVAPSAALADTASGAPYPPPDSALVLGSPRLDARTFPFLPDLPGAREEARVIADLYRHSELRLGDAATARALRQGFGQFAVVHLAAHVLANDEHPEVSALPLAQARPDDPPSLTGADIRRLEAGRTRLVVVSACRAVGISDTEGSRGFAEAFLGAGVPQVVATLWDVDDHAAQVFFEKFHRRLRDGETPPQALRSAQLALLHGDDPQLNRPAAWAGYELIQVAPSSVRRN